MTLLGWSLRGCGSLLGYLYGWVMICSFSLSPRLRCMKAEGTSYIVYTKYDLMAIAFVVSSADIW